MGDVVADEHGGPRERRGLPWLIGAMVALLVIGLAIDQVASGFRTARRLAAPVDPNVVVSTAGIAFRCRDANNCWYVQAIPAFRTWGILRVVDGNRSQMGYLGSVPVESGTRLEVETRGDRISVSVDGVVRRTLTDGALRNVPGAGLAIGGSGAQVRQARWDDFAARSADGTTRDAFTRPDGDRLGRSSSGPWRAARGVWGIRTGEAALVRQVPTGINVAVVNVGADARVGATLTTGAPPTTIVDDFARGDSVKSLGTADTGQGWRTPRGRWGIEDGAAFISRPARRGFDLALIRAAGADGTVEVAVTAMSHGAGLAFRCRGPGNCWRIEAVPELATWNVIRTVRNREQVVTNLGTVPVAPGTTIKVEMDGPRLRFSVDGVVQRSIRSELLADERGAGLAMSAGHPVKDARWSRFRSIPVDPEPLPSRRGGVPG